MIPQGWIHGRVGDLLIGLESGVSVNGEDRAFDHNDKAVLKVSAVSYGKFNPFAAKIINTDEIERAKTNPRAGQVIVSRSNTEELVGASAFIDSDYPNLFLPDKLWQTIPKPASNMKWLSYVLASAHVRYKLSNLATGTSGSMKNITQGELLSLKIAIPPLPEQKKITQILSTWDKAITTTEQLLANSQQQKKALMQQLLTGRKRLKGFGGEWKQVVVGDVCNVGRGRVISKIEIAANTGVYPVYSSQTMNDGVMGYLNSFDFDGDYVTWTTDGVYAGTVFYRHGKFNCTNVCGTLSAKTKELDMKFLALALSRVTHTYVSHTLANPKLMNGVMGTVRFYLPLLEEQQAIAAVLSAADREIELFQQKLEGLRQEKKALMQQLLTGKRRVQA